MNRQDSQLTHTHDIITGMIRGDAEGLAYPTELHTLPLSQLRYDGHTVIDASSCNTFYIDDNGIKHIQALDTSWQKYQGNFHDELYRDDNNRWQKKSEAQRLQEAQQTALHTFHQHIDEIIDTLTINTFGGRTLLAITLKEATRYIAADYPNDLSNYPFLNNQSQLTHQSAKAIVESFMKEYQHYQQQLMTLDSIRLNTTTQINNAKTPEEVKGCLKTGLEVVREA